MGREEITLVKRMYQGYHRICTSEKYHLIKFGIKFKNTKGLLKISISSDLKLHGENLLIIYYTTSQKLQQKIIRINSMIILGKKEVRI